MAGCALSVPGGACRFADFAGRLLMSVGAAGSAGFQVLVNPGHLLGYHREGSRGGNNRPAQLVRAFDLVLHGLRAGGTPAGLGPFPAFELGHEAIGVIGAGRQQIRRMLQGPGQASVLAWPGRAEVSCVLPQLALAGAAPGLVPGRCFR